MEPSAKRIPRGINSCKTHPAIQKASTWETSWAYTLPKTNGSPLKIRHPKRKFIFQPSIFRCFHSLFVSGSRVILVWVWKGCLYFFHFFHCTCHSTVHPCHQASHWMHLCQPRDRTNCRDGPNCSSQVTGFQIRRVKGPEMSWESSILHENQWLILAQTSKITR